MSLFDSTAKDAKLRSAAKKLAAGLHVPQSSNEVNDVMEIISRNISADISNNVDEDPDVDLAVHTLQSRATSSIEFATNYDKLADKNIPGFGELMKGIAMVAEDSALRKLVSPSTSTAAASTAGSSGSPSALPSTSSSRRKPLSVSIADRSSQPPAPSALGRVQQSNSNLVENILSPSTWGKMQQVQASGLAPQETAVESPSSLMAELARVNLGRVPRAKLSARDGAVRPDHSARTDDSAEDVEGTPLAILFNQPFTLRSESGVFLNADASTMAPCLGPCPSGPLEFSNASFRGDNGVVKYGDVLTIKLGNSHPVALASNATPSAPVALVADHSTASVSLRVRALAGTDRWSLCSATRDGSLGTSLATVASCGQIIIRAKSGQYLGTNEDDTLPVLADMPKRWYVVQYNAPFVVPIKSAMVPSRTYAPNGSDSGGQVSLPIGSYPVQVQEILIVEDLLYVLLGIDGQYVIANVKEGEEPLNPVTTRGIDISLAYLLRRVLPMVNAYTTVRRYVHTHTRYEYGMTCHALAAAIRSLLHEFVILVAQLEHQMNSPRGLPLQRLFFYVQPSLHTMQALQRLVLEVDNERGGALLDRLARVTTVGGDRQSRLIYDYLQKKAAIPFYEMLTNWVHKGELNDPFSEFMVTVNESQRANNLLDDFNTKYWEERYTICEEMLPAVLKGASQRILVTGKYLNVLRSVDISPRQKGSTENARSSGRGASQPLAQNLVPGNERENNTIIDAAFAYSAKALLDLVMVKHNLMPRLRALKHYFLIDQGDFFVHFMHTAEEELRKECSSISTGKLESLLDASITMSVLGDEAFRDSLRCTLLPYTLIQHLELVQQLSSAADNFEDEAAMEATRAKLQRVRHQRLKGMEAFALDYDVEWPLSLIISRKELTKYQLVFRHLFFCNHVQRQLSKTWLGHQSLKELDLRGVLTQSYILRQRMLHFMQNFLYYMMVEVLEVRHHQFELAVLKCTTLDELLEHHAEFLDTCLKECLLSHHELLRCVTKIMSVCLLFSEQMEHFSDANRLDELLMEDAENTHRRHHVSSQDRSRKEGEGQRNILTARRTRLVVQSTQIRRIVAKPEYARMIQRFETNFDETLGIFMKRMIDLARSDGEYQSHISNLITRMDYNGFYSKYLNLSGDGHGLDVSLSLGLSR